MESLRVPTGPGRPRLYSLEMSLQRWTLSLPNMWSDGTLFGDRTAMPRTRRGASARSSCMARAEVVSAGEDLAWRCKALMLSASASPLLGC